MKYGAVYNCLSPLSPNSKIDRSESGGRILSACTAIIVCAKDKELKKRIKIYLPSKISGIWTKGLPELMRWLFMFSGR